MIGAPIAHRIHDESAPNKNTMPQVYAPSVLQPDDDTVKADDQSKDGNDKDEPS